MIGILLALLYTNIGENIESGYCKKRVAAFCL